MNKEIKEILDRIGKYVITPDAKEDFDNLLDYITNLQDTINKCLELLETWDNEGLPATTIVGHIYSDLVPLLKHDSK